MFDGALHEGKCKLGREPKEDFLFTISVIRLRGNSGSADAFALGAERQSRRGSLHADPLLLLRKGVCAVSCLSECGPCLQLVTLAQDRRLAWVLVSRPLLAGRCVF